MTLSVQDSEIASAFSFLDHMSILKVLSQVSELDALMRPLRFSQLPSSSFLEICCWWLAPMTFSTLLLDTERAHRREG